MATLKYYKLFFIFLVGSAMLWAAWPVEPRTSTNVKIFCAYDRVFIEFHESGNIWGTMWLDDNGAPVSCGKMPIEEKSNFKGTI
jgi:hypothetical protein